MILARLRLSAVFEISRISQALFIIEAVVSPTFSPVYISCIRRSYMDTLKGGKSEIIDVNTL
jgi:hypothetical protein